jgi:hypothetical protein
MEKYEWKNAAQIVASQALQRCQFIEPSEHGKHIEACRATHAVHEDHCQLVCNMPCSAWLQLL